MELLNPSFVILLIKMAISILPGVIGIFLIASSKEKKREMRNAFCNKLLGVSNAIPYPQFERSLQIIGALMILFSLVATWFLVLRGILFESV